MACVAQTRPCKAVYVNVTSVIHSAKIITWLVHCFTIGAVYEHSTLSNLHKRLHLYTEINSKKSEGTRFNTFETSIQVSLSSNSSGSEKVVHGLLIQKRCVHKWFVCGHLNTDVLSVNCTEFNIICFWNIFIHCCNKKEQKAFINFSVCPSQS